MSSNFKRNTEIPEFYQGEDVIFNITFYDDRFRTTAIDPATKTLTVQEPDGVEVTVSVSEDGTRPANVGKYKGTFATTKYGLHSYEWVTDNPKIVKPGKFNVIESYLDE